MSRRGKKYLEVDPRRMMHYFLGQLDDFGVVQRGGADNHLHALAVGRFLGDAAVERADQRPVALRNEPVGLVQHQEADLYWCGGGGDVI